jgi:phosphotriesterase-related protein
MVSATVQTVLGPVPASTLGVTSAHEHLFIDLASWFDHPRDEAAERLAVERVRPAIMAHVRANPFAVRDNLRLDDEETAAAEVARFRAAGGVTIVDLTTDELGRDPVRLARLSRKTGANVVMGCGHYIARAHPPAVATMDVAALAGEMIRDLCEGVAVGDPPGDGTRPASPASAQARGGTGTSPVAHDVPPDAALPIRSGAIGEIGTSDPIEPAELRVLEAACRAQLHTGAALYVHLDPWGRAGHAALDACEAAGVPLDRVVLCHLDPSLADLAYARSLAHRGAWVAIDIWGDEDAYGGRGMPADGERVAAVVAAHAEGWASRLLLAQDVCLKSQLRAYGGRGYDHLIVGVAPALGAAGLSASEVDALLIDHPRRVLAGEPNGTEAG